MSWVERLQSLPQSSPLSLSTLLFLSVAGCVVFSTVVYALERFFISVPYPPTLPLVGEKEGARRFSLRTRLRYYIDCKAMFRQAWDEYLSKGQSVIVPGVGFRKEVLLAPEHLRWVAQQPDSVMHSLKALAEMDQAKWSLGNESPIIDSWQGLLVKTELNRVLEGICAALSDELGIAFDAHFGEDTENWKEIDLRPVTNEAIAQANSRFTVGLPLCRDPAYLRNIIDINDILVTVAGVVGGAPRLLQPILGTLLGIPSRMKVTRTEKWIKPLWEARIASAKSLPIDEQPQDHAQMMARYALKNRPEEVNDIPLITKRFVAANFGAVHQTVLQVCNLLLDILASDAEFDTIAKLRKETTEILAEKDDEKNDEKTEDSSNGDSPYVLWTKAKVNKMFLADSASRETLRLHAFANRSMFRLVQTSDLSTPDGHHLPKGTLVSFLAHTPHILSAPHKDPLKYDPFRFARVRESSSTPVSFVSTGTDFLPFGHGRHACPGRFLIDFELKMIIAHVLRCYDVKFPDEYKGVRPENVWMAEATLPPPGARICVRRRKGQ